MNYIFKYLIVLLLVANLISCNKENPIESDIIKKKEIYIPQALLLEDLVYDYIIELQASTLNGFDRYSFFSNFSFNVGDLIGSDKVHYFNENIKFYHTETSTKTVEEDSTPIPVFGKKTRWSCTGNKEMDFPAFDVSFYMPQQIRLITPVVTRKWREIIDTRGMTDSMEFKWNFDEYSVNGVYVSIGVPGGGMLAEGYYPYSNSIKIPIGDLKNSDEVIAEFRTYINKLVEKEDKKIVLTALIITTVMFDVISDNY